VGDAEIYRVGLLGYGFIGKVHAYAYQTLPFYYDPVPLRARVTHVVTSRRETATRAKEALGAEVAETDFRAATENPAVDIVHICTPNHLHKDALVSALEHGKHVYCDKPLVTTQSEVDDVLRALEGYHGVSQMTFQNRFLPATICARRLVQQGALGRVLGFRATYLHGGNADPEAPLKWKLTSAAGGGVIADLGSHVFDLLEHLAEPIVGLSATRHIAYTQRPLSTDLSQQVDVDAEDSVVMLARLSSGAVGTLEATKLATGSEDELRCEIEGSRGALRFNLMDPHHLEYYDAGNSVARCGAAQGWTRINTGQRYEAPATTFPSPKAAIGWIRAHVACLAEFLQAIAQQRPATPDLRQGIRVQRLMQAAHQSADTGQWVDVK
jgi:predicted dehydrogenase